jgi:hypothetical protein
VPDVPHAGPDLDFDSWNRRLVACLRQKLPNVVAVRRGKVATLGYGDRSVTIEDRHPTWFVNFSANMAGLALDRFDDFTARTVAKTLAGYFDDRFSKPD